MLDIVYEKIMLNFKNTLTSKIISLIIGVSFLLADISYAGEYQQGSLRVPIGDYERMKRVIAAPAVEAIVTVNEENNGIPRFLKAIDGKKITEIKRSESGVAEEFIIEVREIREGVVSSEKRTFALLVNALHDVKDIVWSVRPLLFDQAYGEMYGIANRTVGIMVFDYSVSESGQITIVMDCADFIPVQGRGLYYASNNLFTSACPLGTRIVDRDIQEPVSMQAVLEGRDFLATPLGRYFKGSGFEVKATMSGSKNGRVSVTLEKTTAPVSETQAAPVAAVPDNGYVPAVASAATSADAPAEGGFAVIDQNARADNMTQNFQAGSSVTDAQTIILRNLRNPGETIELKRKKEEIGKGWVYAIVLKDGLALAGQGRLLAESWITLKETENSLKVLDIHLGEGNFSEVSQGRSSTIIRFLADYAFKKGKLLQIVGTNNYGLIKLCHDYISAEARYQQADGRILTFSELQEGIEKVFLGFVHPVYSGIMMSLDFTWSKGNHKELKYLPSGEEFEDNIGRQMEVIKEAGKIIARWRDTIQPFPPYQVYIPWTQITIIMQPDMQGKSGAIRALRQVDSSL